MNTPIATVDAVSGWHAVLLVKTGLKPAGDEAEREYLKVFVFPVKRWGFRAPESLTRVADRKGGLPFDSFAELLMPMATRSSQMLPLDSRSEKPSFFNDGELIGVFPPEAGDAKDVLRKTKDLLDEETRKRVDQKRARQESSTCDVEVSVKGVKATAESRNLKRDGLGDWICQFPWNDDPEPFRGTEANVRSHLQVQIAAHLMKGGEDG